MIEYYSDQNVDSRLANGMNAANVILSMILLPENICLFISIRTKKKSVTPMYRLIAHQAAVFVLHSFALLNISFAHLASSKSSGISYCVFRIVVQNVLENVTEFCMMLVALSCITISHPSSVVYRFITKFYRLFVILIITWLLSGSITALTFLLEPNSSNSFCNNELRFSRMVPTVLETMCLVIVIAILCVHAVLRVRESRPVTPDNAQTPVETFENPFRQASDTLTIVAAFYIVLSLPGIISSFKIAFFGSNSNNPEWTHYQAISTFLYHVNGAVLFPIFYCRSEEVRESVKVMMCTKCKLSHTNFNKEVSDVYRRTSQCREALKDPVRRLTLIKSGSTYISTSQQKSHGSLADMQHTESAV